MNRLLSLLLVAFAIAAIWRIEVEFHGWDGLTWLEYKHISIPLGGIIFLAWARFLTKGRKDSHTIFILLAAWGIAAYFVLEFSATAYFVRGPSSIFYLAILGELWKQAWWIAPLIWVASIVFLYVGFSYIFRLPIWCWVTGVSLWSISWHLGLLLIIVFPERGQEDLIHSLKTGWMIPFTVISAGLPIVNTEQVVGVNSEQPPAPR